MRPKCFLKIAGKSNNSRFDLILFDNISHKLLRPSRLLGNLFKFLKFSLHGNKSGPFPLLNIAAYWKSSDSKACTKKLSQIRTTNNDNGGRGSSLRIYVRYCGSAALGLIEAT